MTSDADDLTKLAASAQNFFVIFALVSFISALVVQALHEQFRFAVNSFIIRSWLKSRLTSLGIDGFIRAMGYASGISLLSMPYWQLTGQISAAVSSKLNVAPFSKFVCILANLDPRTVEILKTAFDNGKPPVAPTPDGDIEEGIGFSSTDPRPEEVRAAVLNYVATRAEVGINALHAKLRSWWNVFDYYGGLIVVGGLLYLLTPPIGLSVNVMTNIFVFSWLGMPIVRRTLERLIPFR